MEPSSQPAWEPGESSSSANENYLRLRNAQLLEEAEAFRKLNQDLVDREQLLRLSIEVGKVGVWVWDTIGSTHTLGWSRRLKQIFGLPSEAEVTREMFLSCVHPEDRDRVDWAIMQALAGVEDGFYNIEYRIVHPGDDSLHWVTAQGQAFFNASGQSIRFIGAVVDISNRKQVEEFTTQLNRDLESRIGKRTADLEEANRILTTEIEVRTKAEDALRKSGDYFRKVIDTVPGYVWSSLPDGHIDYLNKRWLDYTGMTHEQATGWGWMAAVHPDDLPGLVAYWKSILAAGEAGQYEARLRRADGEYRWLLFRGTPLKDENGQLVKWYGTNTDIQDLRASEHLARGQLGVLARTLDSLSKESDPEQLPKHVATTIAQQMGAHSVTLWERKGVGLDLFGTYEGGLFQTPQEAGYFGGSIPIFTDAPRALTEALQRGEFALIENVLKVPFAFTLGDGRVIPWENEGQTPSFVALKKHLLSQGVRSMLVSPMMLADQFVGIVGIRFTGSRTFNREEIELTKALAQQAMLAIQLLRLSRQSRETAVMAERNRLAQDIHDTLAQGLTGIIVQLEAADDARSKGLDREAIEHSRRARQLARDSLHEARASVHALRPPALADQQLCSALGGLIDRTTKGTTLQAEFIVQGEPQRLPEFWEKHILRMVQEALANTLRHASATRFGATLSFDALEIRLELTDNGCGFDPTVPRTGMGLTGLKQRTEAMGGVLTIRTTPGGGTSICAVLPTVSRIGNP